MDELVCSHCHKPFTKDAPPVPIYVWDSYGGANREPVAITHEDCWWPYMNRNDAPKVVSLGRS